MISKVSLYFLLPMLIIAFFLSMLGVQQVTFGSDYYAFLGSVNRSFQAWSLEIPDIPKINHIDLTNYDSSGVILKVLIKIANGFFSFINVITTILNVFIGVINVVVQVIQFILTCIYQCKDFINRIGNNGVRFAYV